MADVVLVQPPIRDFYLTAKRTLPIGLASMAAELARHGIEVAIIDALATRKVHHCDLPPEMADLSALYGPPDRSPIALFHQFRHFGYHFDHLAQRVKQARPLLVGISSLFTAYADQSMETARRIKAVWPQAKIVMGGHHPTALPEAVLSDRSVDFVLRGEGEVALPILAKLVCSGQTGHAGWVETVPGLALRNRDGQVLAAPPAFVDDLERLPPPALDLILHRRYRRYGQPATVMMASRGCPLKCSYCCVGAYSLPYRRQRVDTVLERLEMAVQGHGVRFVDFEDENLSLDPRWFDRLLTGMIARWGHAGGDGRPMLELRAMNGLYAPSLTVALIRKMRQAGFTALNLALVTSRVQGLRRFGRPDVRAAIDSALHAARQQGLACVAYIIVGGPGQSGMDGVMDLLYLASRPTVVGVSVFYPAPASRDYDWCRQQGRLPSDFGLMRATALPVCGDISRLEAVTLMRLGRMLNFMKAWVDQGRPLPQPEAWHAKRVSPQLAPDQIGAALLQAFLHDGAILGIQPDGRLFRHRQAPALVRRFLRGIQADGVCGQGGP